ncbi:MAG: ATP-binding protein [Patescibacteria group bacterium]|nr:ATP-binding protein [Patescibacteria group bacterium]
MISKENFGVLYGQKTTEDALLIYSSYADSKASPQTGDFIVLAPKDESGIKFLSRVDAEIYDEDPIFKSQDKTLIAVHYARIAERELSERDKQKIFSYTYKVKILGTFTNNGGGIDFTTAVRKLPTVSYHARHLLPEEIKYILNKDNQQEGSQPSALGYLCIGDSEQKEKGEIFFDINKLCKKRTMVFAQSGFGKTNLVKTLIYHAIGDTGYGKLVFDLNGEYALKSQKTNGLGDINEQKIKDNLVVYTDKSIPVEYNGRFIAGGKVALNMYKNLSVGDVLNFTTGFSDVMKSFLIYLNDGAGNFMEKIEDYASTPQNLYKDFPDFWGQEKSDKKTGEFKDDAKARPTIMGIRKRIGFLLDEKGGLHSNSSTLVEDVCKYLREGKTVVLDLSMKDDTESSIISTIIVRKIFEINKASFTTEEDIGEPIPCVIFVEEAQNVLSEEFVKSNANPFVRIAKEGRKFGIGLVGITQRPSAISEEIRTQADNFFAFHMGNSDDIRALVKSNSNYDGVIAKFIQSETIPGNLYMVSSTQAFVLPIRVYEFEKMIKTKLYK